MNKSNSSPKSFKLCLQKDKQTFFIHHNNIVSKTLYLVSNMYNISKRYNDNNTSGLSPHRGIYKGCCPCRISSLWNSRDATFFIWALIPSEPLQHNAVVKTISVPKTWDHLRVIFNHSLCSIFAIRFLEELFMLILFGKKSNDVYYHRCILYSAEFRRKWS